MHDKPFAAYNSYLVKLKKLATAAHAAEWNSKVHAALNGEANEELKKIASLQLRRHFGAFFTGTKLSEKLLGLGTRITTKSTFHDPTCGMGDLLVAAAKILPLGKNLSATLKQWGTQLSGTDLHAEFVEGTKTRLVLLARLRHNDNKAACPEWSSLFPSIRVGDGRSERELIKQATHVLLNPPFGQMPVEPGCTWASGRMTEAAGFVVRALEWASAGTEVLAILPDVLRSGAFSHKWRSRIGELASIQVVEPFGVFDNNADVDVFLLRLRQSAKPRSSSDIWLQSSGAIQTVDHLYNVHVGSVVPHRDPQKGKKYPYIHARSVPAWDTLNEFSEFRRHLGTVFDPPFVVIRRTSRPNQPYRAVSTIITGNEPVAVENHLLVCLPKDKSVAGCKKLMQNLKSRAASDFLDQRIRCRHLTVGVVKEIPWILSNEK